MARVILVVLLVCAATAYARKVKEMFLYHGKIVTQVKDVKEDGKNLISRGFSLCEESFGGAYHRREERDYRERKKIGSRYRVTERCCIEERKK